MRAQKFKDVLLSPDSGAQYDRIIQIDLNTLEPPRQRPLHPRFGKSHQQTWPECKEEQLAQRNQSRTYRFVYEQLVRRYGQVCQHSYGSDEARREVCDTFQCHARFEQIRATIERDGISSLPMLADPVSASGIVRTSRKERRTQSSHRTIAISPGVMTLIQQRTVFNGSQHSRAIGLQPLTDEIKGSDGKGFKLTPPFGRNFPAKVSIQVRTRTSPPYLTVRKRVDVDPKSSTPPTVGAFR
ncbi:hypothetical protein NQ317_007144 [Molorchus minor]|uniref:Uncharacterized protein n=1 Tax=Molorchus minor TaxID=1323400 RepID=A0ABQ9J5M9_9CUCU|nr:hypothetical protein NQ317_007144 [Molorchus minor]